MSTFADRTVRAGCALVALVIVAMTGAESARAAVNVVGIGHASTKDDQHGSFVVPVWTDASGASITSVNGEVRDGESTVAAGVLSDIGGGYWELTTPFKLIEDGGTIPHLGRYTIDVTAHDSAGNSVTKSDAGTLDFTLRPQLSPLTFTRDVLDLRHQNTAVSGQLMGAQPGSGDLVPIADHEVVVSRVYATDANAEPFDQQAMTGEDGTFTTPTFDQAQIAYYLATVNVDDEQAHGTASQLNYPNLNQATVHLTASTPKTHYLPGAPIKITGTVRSGQSAGSAPVQGAPIALYITSNRTAAPTIVMSNANGRFSGTVTAVEGQYVAWVAQLHTDYLVGDPASGNLVVPAESAFTRASITLLRNGIVTGRADLARAFDSSSSTSEPQVIRLQYSKTGSSAWRTIDSTTNEYGADTLSGYGYVDGYYRLFHPASDELAPTATQPVHLSRILTRVKHIKASPSSVRSGETVTVTGTLEDKRKHWQAMRRTAVGLFFEAAGSHKYHFVTAGKTDSRGRIALRGRATRDGVWLLQYFGDRHHFDSAGTPDSVNVR